MPPLPPSPTPMRISQEFMNGVKFSEGVGVAEERMDYILVAIWILAHRCWIVFQDSSALRDRPYRDRCCHLANVRYASHTSQLQQPRLSGGTRALPSAPGMGGSVVYFIQITSIPAFL